MTEDGPHPWPELLTIAATPEPGSASPAMSPRALPWAALGPRTTGNRGSAADNSSNQMPWSEHVPADRCRPKMRPSSTLKATVQGKPILPPSSVRGAAISNRPELAASPPLWPHGEPQLGPHTRVNVLIQPEKVRWVVPLLDLDQPRQVFPEGGPDELACCGLLLAAEVQVGPAGAGEALGLADDLTDPGDVVGGLGPLIRGKVFLCREQAVQAVHVVTLS